MTLAQAIQLVESGSNQIGETFYKASDIITLLNNIEDSEFIEVPANGMTDEARERFSGYIHKEFENILDCTESSEIVDLSSAEFNIRRGNEIEIESIDLDRGSIEGLLRTAVSYAIGRFLEDSREEANNE